MKILVLEDDADQLLALKRKFSKTDHEVVCAQDGSFLDEIGQDIETFDAVITDQQMSQVHGLEVIGRLDRLGLNIPVLLRSGSDHVLIEGGLTASIAKLIRPYSFAKFMSKIWDSDSVLEWVESLDR